MSSFKSNTEILNSALSLPTVWSLKNYVTAFEMVPIATFYGNSAVVAVVATLLNVLVLSMSSYVLARFRFKGSRKLKSLFGLALLIPSAALLQPLYLTMKTLGFYDQLLGLIICYAAFSLPVSMYILTSYYLTIPLELEEAAYIDGAGFYYTFWRVIFPLAKPAMATCGVLAFLGAWNEFQIAMTLTSSTEKERFPSPFCILKPVRQRLRSHVRGYYGSDYPQHRGVYPAAKAGDRGLGQRGGQGMSRIDPLNVKRQEGTYL